jgi:hypothetical protein
MYCQAFDLQKPQETMDAVLNRLSNLNTEDGDWLCFLKECQVLHERFVLDFEKIILKTQKLEYLNRSESVDQYRIMASNFQRIHGAYIDTIQQHSEWSAVYVSFSQKKPKFENLLVKNTKDYVEKLSKQKKLREKLSNSNGKFE